jgi:hypothetical protein
VQGIAIKTAGRALLLLALILELPPRGTGSGKAAGEDLRSGAVQIHDLYRDRKRGAEGASVLAARYCVDAFKKSDIWTHEPPSPTDRADRTDRSSDFLIHHTVLKKAGGCVDDLAVSFHLWSPESEGRRRKVFHQAFCLVAPSSVGSDSSSESGSDSRETAGASGGVCLENLEKTQKTLDSAAPCQNGIIFGITRKVAGAAWLIPPRIFCADAKPPLDP